MTKVIQLHYANPSNIVASIQTALSPRSKVMADVLAPFRKVDAANARLEFSSGAVANITASRVGTEKIRKMRFFQPYDYVAVDYTTKRASVSSLERPTASGAWPGVHVKHLDIIDVEPLRAEIVSFLESVRNGELPAVSGREGRNALSLALRTLERIREHAEHPGVSELSAKN